MEATEVSIKDILSCREFPVVVVREKFSGVMETTNLMNKYAVAVPRNDG